MDMNVVVSNTIIGLVTENVGGKKGARGKNGKRPISMFVLRYTHYKRNQRIEVPSSHDDKKLDLSAC